MCIEGCVQACEAVACHVSLHWHSNDVLADSLNRISLSVRILLFFFICLDRHDRISLIQACFIRSHFGLISHQNGVGIQDGAYLMTQEQSDKFLVEHIY